MGQQAGRQAGRQQAAEAARSIRYSPYMFEGTRVHVPNYRAILINTCRVHTCTTVHVGRQVTSMRMPSMPTSRYLLNELTIEIFCVMR